MLTGLGNSDQRRRVPVQQRDNEGVPSEVVDFIKANYPREHWLVEFEAAYIERNIPASQIEAWVRKACNGE